MISTVAEKKLERDVIKAFRDAGWYARHVDPSPGEAGFPDVLAICGNKYALVELKTKTTLRPSQKAWARKYSHIVKNRFKIEFDSVSYSVFNFDGFGTSVHFQLKSAIYEICDNVMRRDNNEH